MAIIYETINLYNKENGLSPWRYIGSDQHSNPEYFGSSLPLKEDISKLGTKYFVKNIIEDCGDIDNKTLRRIEAEKYLKPNKVKSDETYYNQSEIYGIGGGKKGMRHRVPRSKEHVEKIIEHRTGSTKDESARNLMRQRKLGSKATANTKRLMSVAHNGEKNPNSLSWTITTPDGETLNIKALRKWARDNNHNYYDIYDSKNGWTSIKHGTGKGGGRKKKEQTSGN